MKTYFFICCFLLLFFDLAAKEQLAKKKTVCLNMIVKNETKVIKRCLSSVKPFIDYWVIVDTGSTDGTQQMIKQFMKDMPGELYERAWINFAHNRNEALELAKNKGDYILFIDADEVLAIDEDFKMPALDKDFYYIMTDYSGMIYARIQLIQSSLDWKWIGVVHETLDSTLANTNGVLDGIRNIVHTDGARSEDPKKYQKDAEVLEMALKEEPDNSRYIFYLAQSYKDAGACAKALENYEKRVKMGGWDQEVFWSMLQVGLMQDALNMAPEIVMKSLYHAYHYRPTRAEPLYHLANYYRQKENYALGYLIATIGQNIPLSKDILFVDKWIYDYGLLLELSICAYWIGKYEECYQISQKLLNNTQLPLNVRACVEKNLSFAQTKLIELALQPL